MSRSKPIGDFDVITGPPAVIRRIPPAAPPSPPQPAGLTAPAPAQGEKPAPRTPGRLT